MTPEAYVAPPGTTEKPFVSPRLARIIHGHYFADATRRAEPLASPGLAGPEQLQTLPPLMIFAAARDSLRPPIERLHAAGVDVEFRCMPGVDHGYTNQPGKDGVPALQETARLISQFLVRHHS
jgi:acetyl esterase/lipase